MTSLPALPYLAPWYRLVQLPGRWCSSTGSGSSPRGAGRSRLVPALLPLLDGTRTLDEIVGILGDRPGPRSRTSSLALARRSAPGRRAAAPGRRTPPVRRDRRAPRLPPPRRRRGRRRGRGAPRLLRGRRRAARRWGWRSRGSCARAVSRSSRADGPAAGVDLTICAPDRGELPLPPDVERGGNRCRAPVAPGAAVRRALCRRRAALPPGRHVLLRVLPAPARREPRGGRGACPARGRACGVSRRPRPSMRSPRRSPCSSRSAGSCSGTTTRRPRSMPSSSCRRSR